MFFGSDLDKKVNKYYYNKLVAGNRLHKEDDMRWLTYMGISVILLILAGNFCGFEATENFFSWFAFLTAVVCVAYLIMVRGTKMPFDRHERRNIWLFWASTVACLAMVYVWWILSALLAS